MAGLEGFPGFLTDFVVGSTKDFTIEITDETVSPAVPVDLTGAKFYITIDANRSTTEPPTVEVVIDPPTDPTNGLTTGSISDSDTLLLGEGDFYYSVRYVTGTNPGPAGKTYVIDLGKINGRPAVSSRIS